MKIMVSVDEFQNVSIDGDDECYSCGATITGNGMSDGHVAFCKKCFNKEAHDDVIGIEVY